MAQEEDTVARNDLAQFKECNIAYYHFMHINDCFDSVLDHFNASLFLFVVEDQENGG